MAIESLPDEVGATLGNVGVTVIVPGTGATNLGKAEGAAQAAGDTNVGAMGVASAAPATPTGVAAGDYTLPQQATGGGAWIRNYTKVISVTPTVDTAAYASGDLLVDTASIAAAFLEAGGSAILDSIDVIDLGSQSAAFTIIISNTTTSFGTINAAPNISDANVGLVHLGQVSVAAGDYITVSGTTVASYTALGIPVQVASGTTLYFAVINGTGAPDYVTAGDLIFKFGFRY